MNWLSQDDSPLAIDLQKAPEQALHLINTTLLVIVSGFLISLSALLLANSWLLWWRRQRCRWAATPLISQFSPSVRFAFVPELPEVETTRRGIAPYVVGQTVIRVIVRERRLRWPVSAELETALAGTVIRTVERRAKYLLLCTDAGCALVHLGMSGSLCILSRPTPAQQHDHVDVELASGHCLRFTDPRRFGAWLWTAGVPEQHTLLRHLGPEPLGEGFTAGYLHALARGRRMPVKAFVMDSRVVAGVGNIYANEALFLAGINPLRAAGRIAFLRYEGLVKTIRDVLAAAILQGGTTLRDFVGGEGKAGYFQQYLQVYGREGCPCLVCGAPIRMRRLGQRSTFYCPRCQR